MKKIAMICGAVVISFVFIFLIDNLTPSEEERFAAAVQNGVEETERYGQLKLKLSGCEPDASIAVLINGEESAFLDAAEKYISAQDGSIIEIDGSGLKQTFQVEITEQSENISGELVGASIQVNGTIAVLAHVKLR